MARRLVLCLAALASTAVASDCDSTTLDFLLLNGNANQAVDGVTSSLVDKIIADLAEVGITAVPRAVDKDGDGGFNAEMVAGNFDIVFSEVRGGGGGDRARARRHCRRARETFRLTPSPPPPRRPGARRTTRTATSRRGPRRTRRTTRS